MRIFGFALIAVLAGTAGWFAHARLADRRDKPVQWEFVEAAERGDVASLERLLHQGAAIDATPTQENGAISGFPALFLAAGAGQAKAVLWLLEHGADPNQPSSDSNPLGVAETHLTQATETVDILKKRGARSP